MRAVRDTKVAVLGGAWTRRTLGRDLDAVKIAAAHTAAAWWRQLYGLQLSARYDLELAGRDLLVCSPMLGAIDAVLFDLFCDLEDDSFVYDDALHDVYVELLEVAIAVALAGDKAQQDFNAHAAWKG